jgi:lipid-binding SYLF domain-containing protein
MNDTEQRTLTGGLGALLQKALAILVFPKIIKGGFIIGGQCGEGALREKGKTIAYYNIAAASFGLQAAANRSAMRCCS